MTAAPSLVPDSPVQRMLARLKRVKPIGSRKWMAECPVHSDGTQSLSLTEGRDARVLMNCHAGCETTAIVAAVGLRMSDLYAAGTKPPSSSQPSSASQPTARTVTHVKSYDYTDADGSLVFQSCRFVDTSTGKKTFRQRRPDGKGGWVWSLGDIAPVLYRLPELIAAVEDGKRVFVVEGEKDADALSELGYTATTNPMGAGKWREAFTPLFKDADVVILPDNDEPGRSHAEQVAASLVAAGATVKVVALPNLPEKGDVSDWLDAGGDLDTLESLIGSTPRWTGDAMQQAHRTRWRLDELLENDAIMRPPPEIVPRLAWASRSTLLAAREKAGKSTLTGYITAAVSKGSRFLGQSCQQGDVLVIGIEEFVGDTARRLRHFGADPRHVYLVDRFAGDASMKAQEFRDHVESVAPLLVIIDTFAAYGRGLIADENNASQVQEVVQPLTDVVHQLGCALILVHHTTKSTGKARGSTGITGGVDVVCEFDIPQEDTDPTLRRIRSVGRVPVPRLYDVRFDGNDYTLADGVEAPLDERIITAVQNRPGCTAQEVADSLDARRTDVLTRIGHMIADGRLRNDGRNSHYKLVVPGNPLNPLGR